MSEPTLDDLRVRYAERACGCSDPIYCSFTRTMERPLTPAEFDRIATERGYVKPVPGSVCAGSGYCALSVSAREVLPEYDQEAT